MEAALTAAVEPVRRVRGIKNKDINPVSAYLSLQGGQPQICQAVSEAPLSLLRHALLVRSVGPRKVRHRVASVCMHAAVLQLSVQWQGKPSHLSSHH